MDQGTTRPTVIHPFAGVPAEPLDPFIGLLLQFAADPSPDKVGLLPGAYRTDEGKPWVLPCIQMAKDILYNDPSWAHEYGHWTGNPVFNRLSQEVVFGADSPLLKDKRVASMQTLGATGANYFGGVVLKDFFASWASSSHPTIYIPQETWVNHVPLFKSVGLRPVAFPYYDPTRRTFDFEAVCDAMNNAPDASVFLLHAVGQNPTGCDPTKEQWRELADIFLRKRHFAFFDTAYLGFVSGDYNEDAWSIRHFASRDVPLLVAQSYGKMFGLYGERLGSLHVVLHDEATALNLQSQYTAYGRAMTGGPPLFPERLATLCLATPALRAEWEANLRTIAGAMRERRARLRELLEHTHGTPGTWQHVTEQVGMFSYLGLTPEQCKHLMDKYHVYIVETSRMSVAGLNSSNIERVAECIDRTVREVPFP